METQNSQSESNVASQASGIRFEHKHGLDEWSPMLPERTAQTVVLGEQPPDEVFRCQRVGCNEVIRTRPPIGGGSEPA